MVQFNKVRLSGFKSFVESTELVIEDGLTGVVGPNGCGKSNLLEALRWAMGEGSAKQMRGGGMDDVIFNGTNERPARNIAEVVISLKNNDRKFPPQWNELDELEIVRRIERGEGSHYKVNGQDVRARDVQLLFADLSTGARSTAIVSQGKVGALINAKPAQRRMLLEEAAGITGLHSRRHEAELRLRGADNNLARLDDVIGALAGQMQGLKRQARQATRYRNIGEQIRACEAIQLHLRWREAAEEMENARTRLRDAEAKVTELAQAVSAGTGAQAKAAEAMPALRLAEAEAAAELQRLAIARDTLDKEEEQLAEARAEYQTRLQQIEEDLTREQTMSEDAAAALARIEAEAEGLADTNDSENDARSQAARAVAEAEAALEIIEAALTRLTQAAAEAEAHRSGLDERLEALRSRQNRLSERAQSIEIERQALAEKAGPDADAGDAAARAADRALEEARAGAEAAEVANTAARAREAEIRGALLQADEALASLRAEARGLEALRTEADDLPDAVVGKIRAEPGFEAALSAALGDDLRASIDDTQSIHWIATNGPEGPALPGGSVRLGDHVEAPAALARRLTQIGVVANLAEGGLYAPKLAQGQRLVSRAGDLWRWDGFVALAEAGNPAETRLRQANRLAEIAIVLTDAEGTAQAARAAAEKAKVKVAATTEAERTAREAHRTRMAALSQAREAQARAAKEAAERTTRARALEEAAASVGADLAEIDEELTTAEAAADIARSGEDSRAELGKKQSQVQTQRGTLDELRQTRDRLRAEAEARERRRNAIVDERRIWEARIENGTRQFKLLGERRNAAKTSIERLAGRPAEIQNLRAGLLDAIETAEAKRSEAARTLEAAEARLAEVEGALRAAEGTLADIREERGRSEGAVSQADQAIEAVTERIRERLGCAPEAALDAANLDEGAELPALDDIETKLDRLTRERDNMGPVNLRAERESEELGEQISTMETEREDLLGAISRFRQAINELNREGRQRLLASFEKVDVHFRTIFESLFGGGQAFLKLIESDDPLEAGLEIMASPPGKRLQAMSLLSGGEQALTALSLLFAVFMTNPAPICVLDEVDAPLDDANVDRFCTLLDTITNETKTRFLLITHHRMTMARMDRLFGVTMGEKGVSQLVSVDLREAERLRTVA
ncbi:MAG TPA: AAA family ATPase [Alphaproteobacteria bacterium]|nr:AAA family ATPase [Alphaproteobacteria bacterium]